ncbi:MAG: ZmpA/ZmpB/ZmpC family metallo-endopeptidase [Gemella sp.]|nr:ZmpA/ZmpB/ZmpC family metallo-endopeptidase [Gemella sp.]
MFNKNYLRKFSIRKLKVSAASVFIGLSFLGASTASAETLKLGVEKNLNYKYVLESELTDSEKQLIVKELPSDKVGEYETYYMVYRPETAQVLPKTIAAAGENGLNYLASGALGLGLLVLAVKFSKKKKKYIISSIFILTAAGTYSVSAIENVKLAGNDKVYTVQTGQELPETKIAIPGHQFVGYILVDNVEDLKEACPPEEKVTTAKQTVQTAANVVAKPQGQAAPQVTEKPVTQPTEAPVTRVVTQEPATQIVTEAPVTKIVTEAPVTRVVTQAPVTQIVTEAPATRVVSNESTTVVVTEAPATRVITQAPVTQIVTEAPVTKVITEAPVTKIVTEKGIPLVEEIKPEAPTPEITSKGEGQTRPEAPVLTIPTTVSTTTVAPETSSTTVSTTTVAPETSSTTVSTTTVAPETSSTTVSTTTVAPETSVTTTTVTTETTISTETSSTTTKAVVDKTKLQEEYGLENDSKQTDKYKYATDELRTAYDKLLTEANEILANPDVTQAQVDEALKLLTEARVKLNGLLVEEQEEKEFTRIIEFVDETGKSIRTAEEQKVKFIRTVIKNGNTNQTVEEKPWTSDKDFFDKFVPVGIEGYKTDETEVPQLPVQVLATPETTRVTVRYNKVAEDKVKPELKVTKLEKFDKEQRAALTFDLTDKDKTYVKGQVLVYNDKNELVQTVDIVDNKADIANLEHCLPYRFETVLTYDLGKGAGQVKETVDTREVELVDKKIEFKNLISTELYKVDETGKATQVTALTQLPTDKNNYMIKLVDSENKEILLAVNDIVEKDGKYQVSAKMDNLVHYSADKATEDFVFDVNKVEVKADHYTTFKELVDAMKAKPNGTFYLAADMIVDGDFAGDTYIPGDFTGSIQSETGKNFSISGMTKPLFNKLAAGSKVSNLEIKDANVTAFGASTGILAKTAANSTITNLTLKGNLTPGRFTSPYSAGSVAGEVNAVTITNSLIDTNLTLHASSAFNMYSAGGVFGKNAGNSKVSNVSVNVDIVAPNNAGYGQSIGGVIGDATGGTYEKIQVTGTVKADQADSGVAAIVGKITAATVKDIVTGVQVTNGSIGNGQNMWMWLGQQPPQNIYTINGVASGGTQPAMQTATGITQDQANKYATDWKLPTGAASTGGATTGATPTSASEATYPVDYSTVTGAKAGFETAYQNLAKLLPFYDRKTIVKTANKLVDGDKLKSTAITSIVPMKGNDFVTDLFDTTGVNKLLVHFADGTVKEYDLTATGESPNSRITEFKLDNGMLYTPHNFDLGQNNYDSAIAKLQAVEYNSDAVAKVFNVDKARLPELYLETSFNEVKANLDEVLKSIMSNQVSADMTNGAVSRYVENELTKNKEKLLLGLAYLNRLYDINYGDKNIKDLAMYRPDFLTDSKVDNVAYLESLSDIKFENFRLFEADVLYKAKLAGVNGQASIPAYLDKYRQLFAPDKETKDWFLESSKAKIVEADTNIPGENNSIYDRLSEKDTTHANLLLLLNVADDTVYAVVHPGAVTYGAYAPYMPKNTGEQVEGMVDKYAERLTNYYNIWNNVIKDDMKSKFAENPVRIVDGHFPSSDAKTWTERYPNSGAVDAFFGPAGYYYPHNASESAYADRRTLINMVDNRLLEDASLATATHEFIHHFDEKVLFNGYKYRPGQNIESYALGLLESLSGSKPTYYGFNTLYEFGAGESTSVNHSTSRFQSAKDMQDYMKGVFDVTYTLDALEADIMKSKSAADKQKLYQQITLVPAESADGYTHANDSIVALSNDVANKLTSIKAFVENGVVAKGHLNVDGTQVFTRDNKNPNYTYVDLYKPIFAGISNNTGTVGSLQFRRTAFEFLAAKGWEEGFLKYATNKLAVDNGTKLTDPEVFKAIFGTEYANYADFKTKQFENHLADITKLKDITITLNGKQEVVNGTTIRRLMETAVNDQVNPGGNFQKEFALKTLKEAILTEYMKQTGDFKQSIYK